MTYFLATPAHRPCEVWHFDGARYQQLAARDGILVPRGEPSSPSIFATHRRVLEQFGGASWREVDEAEAKRALSAAPPRRRSNV